MRGTEELARQDELVVDELDDLRVAREELNTDKRALEDDLVRTEENWEREHAKREGEGKVWTGQVEDVEKVQARVVDELEQVSKLLDIISWVYRICV